MTKIKFTGATAIASNHEALTVGAVGLVVRFEFNSAWDGLHKIAVFHCGGVTKDVLDSSFPANICPIPWECLQEEGETLYCGVYGTDSNGNVIIPSKMARLGTVHPAADPTGDESLDPTLPVWQQALNMAQDAMSLLAGKVNRSGDTMQGDLDMGMHTLRLGSTTGMTEDNLNIIRLVADREEEGVTLRNIDTPYGDTDAVNKKYVDDKVNALNTDDIHLSAASEHHSADETVTEVLDGLSKAIINIPTALPNPHKLTINGTSYDGTEDVQMTIQGGGGTSDHSQLTNRDAANQHPITAIMGLQTALDGKADAADIPSLEGYATEAYVQSYHDNTKQDIITDLATIRSGASKGATAIQPEAGKGLFSGSYNDLTDKPAIPDAVTEDIVSGWGFTKNTGTYSKPAGGIPKADLAAAVQTSLDKADSALQRVPIGYRTAAAQDAIDRGKVDKVDGKGLSTNDYTAADKAKVDAIPANPKYTDTVYDDTALKERVATIESKESEWDAKLNASELPTAINTALGYTPANDADVESLSSNQSALSARMDTFTALGEGSTTGDAELMDARVDCEGKTWANAGGHIRGITEKIIDACCDKIATGSKNYNLLKPSECVYMHRQQDNTTELKASNENNLVTGWIPVEYGKYYTISRGTDSGRVTYNVDSSALYTISRVQAKYADGNVSIVGTSLLAPGSVASNSTVYINDANIIAYRVQIHIGAASDISTPALLEAQKVMCTSGGTLEESLNNAKTYEYISGDAASEQNIEYFLKHDDTKADKTEIETVKSDVSELRNRKVSISPKYNGNYIPNDRFLRSIANLRDSVNAKEFEITIHNNSGATIKNAAIAVGMHNTVGINPANNNLPFQVYDNVFSKPTGFKFYDGDTELPYYIESESDCNYIVDKNIKTDQKTMAVFSDGKIAVYNATKARMQLSSDDGVSWTNICDNITSKPYRILLPDSQDNLFVASNDGKKLYKYTSADGYKAGAEVIDLTDTDTCIGSILAEDSVGNLYLGTYQTVFHCVIRKSTDHGNTWTIVFDVTNCQHVHNIFVNKKVTPNEIFIGLDNSSGETVETWVSKDAGETWDRVYVPYGNRDYAFRYAGENFYIGCGERLSLGGATLYKTTDYNDPNAYYPLFDNGQGIRDIINVIEDSDDVLIAGGCVDAAVHQQQLFLSADRGETWKTVLMNPHSTNESPAGKGLRTFSRKGTQILSETNTGYCMRFAYGNGARTILAMVSVGDIPTSGKTITLKTGYVANIEQMDDVLTAYENIDGKVADIQICDGYIVDKVSNKRVMTDKTEMVNSRIKIGQTSEHKILAESAYRLNESVNLGKLSRLNFTKGFTVSLLFRKEDGKKYLEDYNEYPIFQSGNTKLVLYRRSLRLMSGSTSIWGDTLYIQDPYLGSVNEDYVRLTVYFTADELPSAGVYTENKRTEVAACAEYPIAQNLSENDFIIGSSLAGAPNIARIEIYNRVLTHGEIMALTNGCNLVTNGSMFN